MSTPPLRVYCLPISGGALVAQLALLREISIARKLFDSNPDSIIPHLALGSSGGNISIYVAMAARWNHNGITRIASLLDRDMLICNWWPYSLSFLPTTLIGMFSGSLYRQGYGVTKLFKNIFTREMITNTEVWTGTFNGTKNRPKLFCNKREGETYITRSDFEDDRILYHCEPLSYVNGNIELLAKIVVASSSIPILISQQVIEESNYSDGGVAYASPLIPLSGEIIRIVTGKQSITKDKTIVVYEETKVELECIKGDCDKEDEVEILTRPCVGKRKLQLVYFSCYDMDDESNWDRQEANVFKDAGVTINRLIDSLAIIDRARGVEILQTLAEEKDLVKKKHYPQLNAKSLSIVLQEAQSYKHYYLNLFPHGSPYINMLCFTTEDIYRVMNQVSKCYGAYLWYIE